VRSIRYGNAFISCCVVLIFTDVGLSSIFIMYTLSFLVVETFLRCGGGARTPCIIKPKKIAVLVRPSANDRAGMSVPRLGLLMYDVRTLGSGNAATLS
jgi:hypothetical protein